MSEARYRVNSPQVAAEAIDDEVIAINMATGVYFNMRGWSAYVWALLASGHTPEESENLLVSAVGGAGAGSVGDFLAALLADDLLAPDPGAVPGEVAPMAAADWSGLVLERFTDMTDLILLDPVHDVNPTDGWPTIDPGRP